MQNGNLRRRFGAAGENGKDADLIAVVETTARDPLVGAFALIAVGVLVSRLLLKLSGLAAFDHLFPPNSR